MGRGIQHCIYGLLNFFFPSSSSRLQFNQGPYRKQEPRFNFYHSNYQLSSSIKTHPKLSVDNNYRSTLKLLCSLSVSFQINLGYYLYYSLVKPKPLIIRAIPHNCLRLKQPSMVQTKIRRRMFQLLRGGIIQIASKNSSLCFHDNSINLCSTLQELLQYSSSHLVKEAASLKHFLSHLICFYKH